MPRKMPQKIIRFLSCLVLAGNLLVVPNVAAAEGAKAFVVPEGHLSAGVRKFVETYGWSLTWDSEEDRIVNHSFDVGNPALEGGLSNILSAYKGVFASNLDHEKQVVRVTTAKPDVAAEPSEDVAAEGESDFGVDGMQWSSELVFEPGLKPNSEPKPAAGEGQKLTVLMLDEPQSWESRDPPPPPPPMPETVARLQVPGTPSPEEPESPIMALDSMADALPTEEPARELEKAPVETAEKVEGKVLEEASKVPEPPRPVLQILSAKDRKRAESERSRMQALGHDVYVEEFRQGDTLWYRLKMRVASGQSVEDAKAKLKSLGHGNTWVVPQDSVQEQPSASE